METSMAVLSDVTFFPGSNLPGTDLASGLLLLLSSTLPVDSMITNVSVIQSWNWFFMLTPFESIFLGFIIAQIAVLNVLGILPINLNKIVSGEPGDGKRKKRQVGEKLDEKHSIAHSLVKILQRMDKDECFVRSLCLVQLRAATDARYRMPKDLRTILTALKLSAARRTKDVSAENVVNMALRPLEEAVEAGLSGCEQPYSNATVCEERYTLCPASSEDIYAYIDHIYSYFL